MAGGKVDHSLKILKIVRCPNLKTVAIQLRKLKIDTKTGLFVLIICLEKMETLNKLKLERFAYLFNDGRPIILQLNFPNKKKLFVKKDKETKFISWSSKEAASIPDIKALKKILEVLGKFKKDFQSARLSEIPKESKWSEQIAGGSLCIRVLKLFEGGIPRLVPWLTDSSVLLSRNLEAYLSYIDYRCIDPTAAVELAWDEKRIDLLETLIANDCPFPKKFQLNQTADYSDEFNENLKKRQSLHRSIADRDAEAVSRILEDMHSGLYVYNENNDSAFATALKNFEIGIYTLLLKKNFKFCEKCPLLMKNLPVNLKQVISFKNRELFKPLGEVPNKHQLLSKCHLATGHFHKQFYSVKINGFLWDLQNHPEVSSLLRIAEKSISLKIAFDFQHSDTMLMHPDHKNKGPFDPRGVCTPAGNLYISGKRNDRDTRGVLAHELTHHAMKLLYRNSFHPYQAFDDERKTNFGDVIKECREVYEKKEDVTILSIWNINQTFQNYSEENFSSELIARVPQVLTNYSKKDIKIAEAKYPKLFAYYRKHLSADVSAAFPETSDRPFFEVNLNLAQKVSFMDLTENWIDSKKTDSDLNILIIEKCPSIAAGSSLLCRLNISALNSLFVLKLEVSGNEIQESMDVSPFMNVFEDGRPVILQIDLLDGTETVYLKDLNDPAFVRLLSQSLDDDSYVFEDNYATCAFRQMLETHGHFNGDILSTKMFRISKATLISKAMTSALCLRFINIFHGGSQNIMPWLVPDFVRNWINSLPSENLMVN